MLFNNSKWTKKLWENYREHSPTGQDAHNLLNRKNSTSVSLADDIYSNLYLPNAPQKTDNSPAWSEEIFKQLEGLPEFKKLRKDCQSNAALTNRVVSDLVPRIIDYVPTKKEDKNNPPQANPDDLRLALRQAINAGAIKREQDKENIEQCVRIFGTKDAEKGNDLEALNNIEKTLSIVERSSGATTLRAASLDIGRLLPV